MKVDRRFTTNRSGVFANDYCGIQGQNILWAAAQDSDKRRVRFSCATAPMNERFALMEISKGRLTVAGLLTAVSFTTLGGGTAFAFQEHMLAPGTVCSRPKTSYGRPSPIKVDVGTLQSASHSKRSTRSTLAFNTARATRRRRSRRVLRCTTFANRRNALGIADCQCTNC